MNEQYMCLNIRYDAPMSIWDKLTLIYQQTEGYLGNGNHDGESGMLYWFSFNEEDKHICASVEPSGLCFSGLMRDEEWDEWRASIKAIATKELGYKIGEVEEGEVDE